MVHYKTQQNSGFALLISLIVVTVVITIGLSILDLTLKQLRLSTNSKDSEIAFHAANAGMECARYWRGRASTTIEAGLNIIPQCFGANAVNVSVESINTVGTGAAHHYEFESTWGATGSIRCSAMTILSIVSDIDEETVIDLADMVAVIPGYPEETEDYACPSGGVCTFIASRGYSKACGDPINTPGTIEREVLLEL